MQLQRSCLVIVLHEMSCCHLSLWHRHPKLLNKHGRGGLVAWRVPSRKLSLDVLVCRRSV